MPNRWSYGWVVLAFTLVAQSLSAGAVTFSFPLYMVPLQEEFNAPLSRIMLAIVAIQLSMGVLAPVVGFALEKFNARPLVIAGSLMLIAGMTFASKATAVWHIVLVYATLLPLSTLLNSSFMAQYLVTQWFTEKRGMAVGISATGSALGGVYFPFIATTLITDYGWRESLFISGLIVGPITLVLGWIVLRKKPKKNNHSDQTQDPDNLPGSLSSGEEKIWTVGDILTTSLFWIPVLAILSLLAVYGGIQFSLGTYMHDKGFEPTQTAMLLTIISISMVAGKLSFGALADLISNRQIIWIACLLLIAALVMYGGEPGLLSVRIATAMAGFAGGAILPMNTIFLSTYFGTGSFSRVLGIASVFVMLGAFGSYLAGLLYDLMGNYDRVFFALMFLLVPPAVLMVFLPRRTGARNA